MKLTLIQPETLNFIPAMTNHSTYLTYAYLLTPLHTGASSSSGNLMGIAREAHTELPYIPASSLRGKIRSTLEESDPDEAGTFFGERILSNQQPTEGQVWFSDATLLFFPIASFSHQFVWITCPLWLSRWQRWSQKSSLSKSLDLLRSVLKKSKENGGKIAISSIHGQSVYLRGAVVKQDEIEPIPETEDFFQAFSEIPNGNGILDLQQKLLILSDEDCAALVEVGLQREVRVALKQDSKTVDGGSFRSEEAIPPETVLAFAWGTKPETTRGSTSTIRSALVDALNQRMQFGGLEGLGRGWVELKTQQLTSEE
jgi:CRISPR-associated protein Cmr4